MYRPRYSGISSQARDHTIMPPTSAAHFQAEKNHGMLKWQERVTGMERAAGAAAGRAKGGVSSVGPVRKYDTRTTGAAATRETSKSDRDRKTVEVMNEMVTSP